MNNRWRRVFKLSGKKIINVPMFFATSQSNECEIGIGETVAGVSEKLSNEIIKNIKRKNQKLEERYERK